VIVPSIILHEVSHGVVALWFGDDTAKRAGRITLNPVSHIDPFGTIILPVILAAFGGAILGYAKPVPIDPRRMRNPRNDSVIVALAGPAVNIVLAVLAAFALRRWGPGNGDTLPVELLVRLGLINAVLAVFNLIPIPPLDGSAVVGRFLPRALWPAWAKLQQYGFVILLVVFLALPQLLHPLFVRAEQLWVDLL
jgi:Zn-dependent protease